MDALFGFPFDPALDATNWRSELALRGAVITRKVNDGGNPTPHGAASQQVLASVLRTADQRQLDGGVTVLTNLLRAPIPPPLKHDLLQTATSRAGISASSLNAVINYAPFSPFTFAAMFSSMIRYH